MKRIVVMKVFLILLTLSVLGLAQDIYELDPIVVTATRYPRNIADVTRAITVIDSSVIENYSSLPEILKMTTGIDMKIRGDGIQVLSLKNILDRRHEDYKGVSLPGRSLRIKMVLSGDIRR